MGPFDRVNAVGATSMPALATTNLSNAMRRWRMTSAATRAFRQLVTPLLDLVRVNVEVLRQLNQRSLALDRSYRHFGLEGSTYSGCSAFPSDL